MEIVYNLFYASSVPVMSIDSESPIILVCLYDLWNKQVCGTDWQ